MDKTTKEKIAEFICGDNNNRFPVYRTSSYLTKFFQDIHLDYVHDGSTRKWWVLDVIEDLNGPELQKVILRLASPKLYGGDRELIKLAQKTLNEILEVESLKIQYSGLIPELIRITPNYNLNEREKDNIKNDRELMPFPQPNFELLQLECGIANILSLRWSEIQKCIDNKAWLASVILMGSFLEGFLLGVMQKYPQVANNASNAPRNNEGRIKKFYDWTFGEMIDVAHVLGWIELDVKKFSHSLRDFRNIIHPFQQLAYNTFPDEDTCKISWLVIQAASNDLANWVTLHKQ